MKEQKRLPRSNQSNFYKFHSDHGMPISWWGAQCGDGRWCCLQQCLSFWGFLNRIEHSQNIINNFLKNFNSNSTSCFSALLQIIQMSAIKIFHKQIPLKTFLYCHRFMFFIYIFSYLFSAIFRYFANWSGRPKWSVSHILRMLLKRIERNLLVQF